MAIYCMSDLLYRSRYVFTWHTQIGDVEERERILGFYTAASKQKVLRRGASRP